MICKGDVIENPVTGERMLFLETSADTNGESVLVEVTVQPNGFVAAAHTHPYQTERFEIESGTIAFKVDGKEIVAGPGETVVVPPKSSHKFWNAGETEAVFICEVRPACLSVTLFPSTLSSPAQARPWSSRPAARTSSGTPARPRPSS